MPSALTSMRAVSFLSMKSVKIFVQAKKSDEVTIKNKIPVLLYEDFWYGCS